MGAPAARVSDMHICPLVVPKCSPHVGGPVSAGSSNVLIGGLPAARLGDMVVCMGPPDKISQGSSTVLINGKPAARMGDSTGHGGKIVVGCPTVFIGDGGSTVDDINANVASGFGVSKVVAGKALRQALSAQKKLLEIKRKELKRWNKQDKINFKTWFGSTTSEAKEIISKRIDKVLELNSVSDESNFKPLKVVTEDDKNAFAQVYPADKTHTIELGKPFWDAPASGRDSKAGILTHEMSHFVDIGKTSDYQYGVNECKQLSLVAPQKALHNADNFEFYIEG